MNFDKLVFNFITTTAAVAVAGFYLLRRMEKKSTPVYNVTFTGFEPGEAVENELKATTLHSAKRAKQQGA